MSQNKLVITTLSLVIILVGSFFGFIYDPYPYQTSEEYQFKGYFYAIIRDQVEFIGDGEFWLEYQISDGQDKSRWRTIKIGKLDGGTIEDLEFNGVYIGPDESIKFNVVERDLFLETIVITKVITNINETGGFHTYEYYFEGEWGGSELALNWTKLS